MGELVNLFECLSLLESEDVDVEQMEFVAIPPEAQDSDEEAMEVEEVEVGDEEESVDEEPAAPVVVKVVPAQEPTTEEWNEPNAFLDDNESGRFYSGFNTVRIEKSPSIMLSGMQDAVLGVWCSHGEGKFTYRQPQLLGQLLQNSLVPLRYCNSRGEASMQFPDNPNGSEESVAGLCSPDGRHLALMPHPERAFLSWQWPNYPWPLNNEKECLNSPWMKIFINAFEWSTSQ